MNLLIWMSDNEGVLQQNYWISETIVNLMIKKNITHNWKHKALASIFALENLNLHKI